MRRNLAKAAVIALVAMGASWFIPGELTSLEVFTPKEKVSDFNFSDFYTIAANGAQALTTDPDITVVALDGCSRAEMGRAIAFADSCGAAVIGLDLIFSPPTTTCDSIIAAIDSTDSIVLPIILSNEENDRFADLETSYFEPLLNSEHYHGAVNINGNLENSTTRFFKGEFETTHGPVPAFSTVIAELYSPGITADLQERGNKLEMIRFPNKAFNILTPATMANNEPLITGRIVLMGYLSDPSDIHRTPLSNHTPGLLIHAACTATIINGHYVSYSPQWLALAVAFAACFLMVFAGLHFREHAWGAILVRAIQIALMVGVLYIGSLIFIRYDYSFDFMPTITVTILGLVIMDVVIGLSFLFTKLYYAILSLPKKFTRKRKKSTANDNLS